MSDTEEKRSPDTEVVDVHPVTSIRKDQIGNPMEIITSVISPSGKEIPITGDVDEAMKLAADQESFEATEEDMQNIWA
ncbi:unnamed protein product [Ambrosiozyma monospora]|uniref:Unnamed protein product n=1 Tax=Ambrosiozyma monospora TaxID=43982 RepID=A0ACB5TBC2_AMBMO|nr:unnamed protein product [Ambrosiozyma monospora]